MTTVTADELEVGLASITSTTGVGWVEMARGTEIPHARLTSEKNVKKDSTMRVFLENLGMLDDPFLLQELIRLNSITEFLAPILKIG